MRVAIHTLGTRGDIQPYLALALGLKAQGHEVVIAAPSQFEAFIGTRGIAFAHLPGEFLELLDTPEGKAAIAGSGGFAAGFKMMKQIRPLVRKQLSAEWFAARTFRPDLIIYHPKAIAAPHIGEKLSCPTVLASPLPGFTPTREFASPLIPFRSLGPLNRMTHSVVANSADVLFRKMISEWRSNELELGRKPLRPLGPRATLYAYSPHVLPMPDDWPPNVAVTGYWFLEDERNWQPDPTLGAFLDAGEAPVYVGFGSMPGLDPRALTALVFEALALSGRRGVLATGGGALNGDSSAPHVHLLESAPHDKLFPLMSACVHHGGAGTTGASLRAGKPTIICPFFGDQPFWARRVEELGLGPAPLDRKKLTAASLAAAITASTTNMPLRRKAIDIGVKIRAEDGVVGAIAFLQSAGLLAGSEKQANGKAGETTLL